MTRPNYGEANGGTEQHRAAHGKRERTTTGTKRTTTGVRRTRATTTGARQTRADDDGRETEEQRRAAEGDASPAERRRVR